MTNELIRNLDKARTAAVDAVKALPQQIRDRRIDIPDLKLTAFGRTLVSVPSRTIDLRSIELPKAEILTDKLGQVKVFAPIDVDAVVQRVGEVGDYLQTLPAKITHVPQAVQEFVTDLPDSATRLVEETTTKAKAIVEDLKTRPILFVPSRRSTNGKAAAKSAKKPVAAKKTTTKTTTSNGSGTTA